MYRAVPRLQSASIIGSSQRWTPLLQSVFGLIRYAFDFPIVSSVVSKYFVMLPTKCTDLGGTRSLAVVYEILVRAYKWSNFFER